MGILRLKGGCDFSKVIGQEEQIALPSNGNVVGKKGEGDDDVSEDGEAFFEIFLHSSMIISEEVFRALPQC